MGVLHMDVCVRSARWVRGIVREDEYELVCEGQSVCACVCEREQVCVCVKVGAKIGVSVCGRERASVFV